MEITIGRIVLYQLTAEDAEQINRRRTTGSAIAARIKNNDLEPSKMLPGATHWPLGAQAHIGNDAKGGELFPMLVTKVWDASSGCVNGQVFLDGNDCLWTTSVMEGPGPRTWVFPSRV